MATRAQKVRLSIFLIATSAIIIAFFLLLVGNRLLRRMETFYIEYRDISVTGLEPGAAVKFHGVQVGRVSALRVKDAATVIIEIEVSHGTPIKEDTEAILTLVGITGLKFVELIGGTEQSAMLPPRSTIVAGHSILDTISGSAEILLAKLEQIMNNINALTGPEMTESVNRTMSSLAVLSEEAGTFMQDNREPMTATINDLKLVMGNLTTATGQLDSTLSAINTIVHSDEVRTTVENVNYITGTVRSGLDSLQLAQTSRELHDLLANANKLVINYDYIGTRARDDILTSLRNLEETLENLREATDVIRENPSVLIRGRRTSGDLIE
jgi:phospholipid/cholesterol/gamma-HCH transport system substrate-binding protein